MANSQLFSNNAIATLTQSLTNVATTISGVLTAEVALFGPSTTASGDFEIATLYNGSDIEIIKITDITADVFTIVRAQQGTTALSFTIGTSLYAAVTADMMANLVSTVATNVNSIDLLNADVATNTSDIDGLLNSIVTVNSEVLVDPNGNVAYTL